MKSNKTKNRNEVSMKKTFFFAMVLLMLSFFSGSKTVFASADGSDVGYTNITITFLKSNCPEEPEDNHKPPTGPNTGGGNTIQDNQTAQKLPQTNEQVSFWQIPVGLLLIVLGLIVGWYQRRSEYHD